MINPYLSPAFYRLPIDTHTTHLGYSVPLLLNGMVHEGYLNKDDFKITTATKPSIVHALEIILVTQFWNSNFNCLTLGLNPISVAMLKRSLSRVIKAKIHLVLMNYWQFIFTQLQFPARLYASCNRVGIIANVRLLRQMFSYDVSPLSQNSSSTLRLPWMTTVSFF